MFFRFVTCVHAIIKWEWLDVKALMISCNIYLLEIIWNYILFCLYVKDAVTNVQLQGLWIPNLKK